jgi:hypothetical protein
MQTVKQHTRLFSLQQSVVSYGARAKTSFEHRAIHLEMRMIEVYAERVQVALCKFQHPYSGTIRIRRGALI